MSEEQLQLLITIDNPGDPPDEDAFSHLQVNNITYWLGRRAPSWRLLVCTTTHRKNGEVVERKVFYDM